MKCGYNSNDQSLKVVAIVKRGCWGLTDDDHSGGQ